MHELLNISSRDSNISECRMFKINWQKSAPFCQIWQLSDLTWPELTKFGLRLIKIEIAGQLNPYHLKSKFLHIGQIRKNIVLNLWYSQNVKKWNCEHIKSSKNYKKIIINLKSFISRLEIKVQRLSFEEFSISKFDFFTKFISVFLISLISAPPPPDVASQGQSEPEWTRRTSSIITWHPFCTFFYALPLKLWPSFC